MTCQLLRVPWDVLKVTQAKTGDTSLIVVTLGDIGSVMTSGPHVPVLKHVAHRGIHLV